MNKFDKIEDLIDLIKRDIGSISNITRKTYTREDDDRIFDLAQEIEDNSRKLQKLLWSQKSLFCQFCDFLGTKQLLDHSIPGDRKIIKKGMDSM